MGLIEAVANKLCHETATEQDTDECERGDVADMHDVADEDLDATKPSMRATVSSR